MFDLSKLGDISKLAGEAKQLQERQDRFHKEQIELLKKISSQLDELVRIAKSRR